MELSDLTAYALEKYQIQEQHKWADFPGFSVLCHPKSGKWVALLMRQWDQETGTEIQRCDMKCGGSLQHFRRPYLTPPVRMRGSSWVGICFDERTEPQIVYQLLDQAIIFKQRNKANLKDQPSRIFNRVQTARILHAAPRHIKLTVNNFHTA